VSETGAGALDTSGPFSAGECVVRPDVHEIEAPHGTVRLEPKAMGVLRCLAAGAGAVIEREQILDQVWRDAFVTEEVLTHCIWELRKAFGDNARNPAYIQTVPRKGYRFLPTPAALPDTTRIEKVPSLAVLPFRDLSQTGDSAYFCDGMVEELTHALSRLRGLRVLSRSSARRFQDRELAVSEIGSQLGVDLLLEGSVRPAGDRYRTLARLVEVDNGFDLWADAYHHELVEADVFRVQQEIARSIVTKVHGDLIGGIEAIGVRPTGDVESYRLQLKARHSMSERKRSSLARATELYREAIERDPEYAIAISGLAEALLLQAVYGLAPPSEVLPEAKALATRALQLDPTRAETYASLGFTLAIYDWSWDESEETFREAMAADPYAATSAHWYGINCLVPQARFDEAKYYLYRAQALDPISAPIHLSLGMTSYFAGDYTDAVERLTDVLNLYPGFPVAHLFLGMSRVELGELDAAIVELESAVTRSERSAESIAGLAYAKARSGARDEALALAAELESADEYVSANLLAQIHAGLGNADCALTHLEAAADARASDFAWLKVRPVFASLRDDPRFVGLLDRLALA